MKVELVDVTTGLAGFFAPATFFKDMNGIGDFVSVFIISVVCAYGAISMMRQITTPSTGKVKA